MTTVVELRGRRRAGSGPGPIDAEGQAAVAVGRLRRVADEDEVNRVESALGEAIEAIEGENR